MSELNICEGTDCSEIAADLMKAGGGDGRILRMTPAPGKELRLMEYGQEEGGFVYHEVYTEGGYVFDPRLDPSPVPLSEWTGLVEKLNPGATIR